MTWTTLAITTSTRYILTLECDVSLDPFSMVQPGISVGRSMQKQSWLYVIMTSHLWRTITARWHFECWKMMTATYFAPSRQKCSVRCEKVWYAASWPLTWPDTMRSSRSSRRSHRSLTLATRPTQTLWVATGIFICLGCHWLRSSWHIALPVAAVHGAHQGSRHIKWGTAHGRGRTLVGPPLAGNASLFTPAWYCCSSGIYIHLQEPSIDSKCNWLAYPLDLNCFFLCFHIISWLCRSMFKSRPVGGSELLVIALKSPGSKGRGWLPLATKHLTHQSWFTETLWSCRRGTTGTSLICVKGGSTYTLTDVLAVFGRTGGHRRVNYFYCYFSSFYNKLNYAFQQKKLTASVSCCPATTASVNKR